MKQSKALFGALTERSGYARVNYSMHISLKHAYLFYETPKSGCSTIKRRLQRIELSDTPFKPSNSVHSRLESPMIAPSQLPRAQINEILADHRFPKFCFVRNPFTRVLSAYLDKIVRNEPQKALFFKAQGKPDTPLTQTVSFSEFLEALALTPAAKMDPHWMPQGFHLFYDLLDYNFVGKFENFENDFSTVARMLFPREIRENIPADVMAGHKTDAANKLEHYFNGKCIDLVKKIYQDDFSSFGYSLAPEHALAIR